jgi:Gpi18-like mannosyltransferase
MRSDAITNNEEISFLNKPISKLSLVILSILLQLFLGYFLGHQFDIKIFMATGYLVANHQNPYVPQNLEVEFMDAAFSNITSFGYPPTYALILGSIYKIYSNLNQNILLYNLLIKFPIIAANITLAFFITYLLKEFGIKKKFADRAWVFLLFSPFLYYFSTSWGQFDSLVALLALASLYLIYHNKIYLSSLLLALSISLKPTSWLILPVALTFLLKDSKLEAFKYLGFSLINLIFLVVTPFIIFDWSPAPILAGWNEHFTVAGGMSIMTLYELINNTYNLPGTWWLIGLLWVPAFALSLILIRKKLDSFDDLVQRSLVLVLVFYLTRSWISEPNLILPYSFMLYLVYREKMSPNLFFVFWMIPFLFTILNNSLPQILFPSQPILMDQLTGLIERYRELRLILRFIIVLPWHYMSWRYVVGYVKSSA